MKKLLLLTAVSLPFVLISCKKEEAKTEEECIKISTTESTKLIEPALNYSMDPSSENCKKYKSALENLMDKLEGCPENFEADRAELDKLEC